MAAEQRDICGRGVKRRRRMTGLTTEHLMLAQLTKREVERYVADSPMETHYASLDDKHHVYAVLAVGNRPQPTYVEVVVMARVVDDFIVIEQDTTDKPLYEALMVNGGVPREKIVLAYAGETLPDPHPHA